MIDHGMTKHITVMRVANRGFVLLAGLALLLVQVNAAAQGGNVEGDRAALEALYHAMDGPNWLRRGNWLTDQPLDSWYGVVTERREGRVDSLQLNFNRLAGPIPPEFGNLTRLQELVLSNNRITDLTEIRNLAELLILRIHGNQHGGPIPTELGSLAALETLHLYSGSYTGPIPAELGNLVELRMLWLQDNYLTGPIPAELGNLTELSWLLLSDNGLSGPVPAELGYGLTKLEYLSLDDNTGLCFPDDFPMDSQFARGATRLPSCTAVPTVPLPALFTLGAGLLATGLIRLRLSA